MENQNQEIFCEVCGAKLTEDKVCRDLYNELSYYSLTHRDKDYFVHQHIVDAYSASHPSKEDKAVKLAFALIGLCLFVNYGYTGRQIQQAHMELAKTRKVWPLFKSPEKKSKITISDILKTTTYSSRDALIKDWAKEVWQTWQDQHKIVMEIVEPYIASKKR